MYNTAIEILKKLEDNGFKAYIIGGYVRDKYLGITSNDIDICTSAKPMDIKNIFGIHNIKNDKYGSLNLFLNNKHFEITTFRKEIEYKKNRIPSKLLYIDSLEEDIKRRDFTINTICIDKDENIIDLLNGKIDLDKKIIKMVGDPFIKIEQDSLRILRAIRFATKLNFKIEEQLFKAIKKYGYLLNNLSYYRKKQELDKIFSSPNNKYGINLIKKAHIDKYLDIDLSNLVYTDDILGIWSQINPINYSFTKHELDIINKINELKNKELTDYDLYYYGLYISSIVADIKNIKRKDLINRYNNLPIQKKEDINIKVTDICNILDIEPIKSKDIFKDLELLILNKKINNNYDDIKNYLQKHYL